MSQSVTVIRDLDLAVGPGFSYGQVSANYTNLKWDNQYNGTKYDGSLGTGESVLNTSSTYFDLNMGFLARFIGRKKNETNIGVSMANLTQTRQATLSSSSDKLLNFNKTLNGIEKQGLPFPLLALLFAIIFQINFSM